MTESYFKSVRIYFTISENNLIFISKRRDTLYSVKFGNFGVKSVAMDDHSGLAVASSPKHGRPSALKNLQSHSTCINLIRPRIYSSVGDKHKTSTQARKGLFARYSLFKALHLFESKK